MRPREYEQHVADVLAAEGWKVKVAPPRRDFGLDVIGVKSDRRLGVQVKMYGDGRPVNAQIIRELYGAAAYQDCTEAMLATNGRVLEDAEEVAGKLGIEIRYIPRPEGSDQDVTDGPGRGLTFDRIWEDHVMPMVGETLTRADGSANTIVAVDWSGLTRITSSGRRDTVDIEIFRWVIERLLRGETVLRDEINAQYTKRASSGIVLVLVSLPMFEEIKVGRKKGVRFKSA